ncbi:hypothetical protein N7462_006495 [Penicillium macrosclerotiorum]|uniref:uncharacterized protein n=1 Tax=Penicillium macrosclerotiorum TaxID=303699 RepID=UPI002548D77D|nr:uncharacterized protein N7462_006495 [Penicillium macrosclerotiorum]KAJ5683330.1 hypothetical protein N7462_006495 [Penicillium macrosclerotiorum]
MNASRVGRASRQAKWPNPSSIRGVQSKAPRPRRSPYDPIPNILLAARRSPPSQYQTNHPTDNSPPTHRPKLPPRPQPSQQNRSPQSTPSGLSPRVLTFFGVTALTISTYVGYLYASYTREVAAAQALAVPRDVSDRYDHTARSFDADVELSEKAMRLGAKRADLVRRARGDVLEVSCGTGRNLGFYELGERRGVDEAGRAAVRGCRSLTLTDLSAPMLALSRAKFEALGSEFARVGFRVCDAGAVEVVKPVGRAGEGEEERWEKGRYYDTVVQTMGLCSMPDPVATLRHLGAITEPEKGRILLLEHGRSYYDWLNRILDNLAPSHADRHGCWWNRDIGAIVKESGLEIVEEKRWHFGTTWRYVLRPRQT